MGFNGCAFIQDHRYTTTTIEPDIFPYFVKPLCQTSLVVKDDIELISCLDSLHKLRPVHICHSTMLPRDSYVRLRRMLRKLIVEPGRYDRLESEYPDSSYIILVLKDTDNGSGFTHTGLKEERPIVFVREAGYSPLLMFVIL